METALVGKDSYLLSYSVLRFLHERFPSPPFARLFEECCQNIFTLFLREVFEKILNDGLLKDEEKGGYPI